MSQLGLFGLLNVEPPQYPPGLVYRPEIISREEEASLVEALQAQPFKPVIFQGYEAHRREVSYGWSYDFARGKLEPAAAIPDFLRLLQTKAAALVGASPEDFKQALLLEYPPGAAMGWHTDKADFEVIVGFSLLSHATLRFRMQQRGVFRRVRIVAERCSAYVLCGEARDAWEHSVPPVETLRYSVTFRSLRI